nr:unnamed protein product [Spirometra erinaceieuropaei]
MLTTCVPSEGTSASAGTEPDALLHNAVTVIEVASLKVVQRLATFPVAAAAEKKASVENRRCQLRDTIQSMDLAVLGRARRQHQDWFGGDDAVIRNLLLEKIRLHKTYVDCPTDDDKAAFYLSRRLLQQRLRGMQDA